MDEDSPYIYKTGYITASAKKSFQSPQAPQHILVPLLLLMTWFLQITSQASLIKSPVSVVAVLDARSVFFNCTTSLTVEVDWMFKEIDSIASIPVYRDRFVNPWLVREYGLEVRANPEKGEYNLVVDRVTVKNVGTYLCHENRSATPQGVAAELIVLRSSPTCIQSALGTVTKGDIVDYFCTLEYYGRLSSVSYFWRDKIGPIQNCSYSNNTIDMWTTIRSGFSMKIMPIRSHLPRYTFTACLYIKYNTEYRECTDGENSMQGKPVLGGPTTGSNWFTWTSQQIDVVWTSQQIDVVTIPPTAVTPQQNVNSDITNTNHLKQWMLRSNHSSHEIDDRSIPTEISESESSNFFLSSYTPFLIMCLISVTSVIIVLFLRKVVRILVKRHRQRMHTASNNHIYSSISPPHVTGNSNNSIFDSVAPIVNIWPTAMDMSRTENTVFIREEGNTGVYTRLNFNNMQLQRMRPFSYRNESGPEMEPEVIEIPGCSPEREVREVPDYLSIETSSSSGASSPWYQGGEGYQSSNVLGNFEDLSSFNSMMKSAARREEEWKGREGGKEEGWEVRDGGREEGMEEMATRVL